MCRMRGGLCGLGTLLLFVAGCASSEPNIKPTLPEQYALPPGDDPRFSTPIAYPKETLFRDRIKTDSTQPGLPNRNSPRMGAGNPGLGGF